MEQNAFYLKEPSAAYSFDSTQYSPLVQEMEQGTDHILAVVRCSFSGIPWPDIELAANLVHHLSDTDRDIPETISILDEKREDNTMEFFIELQTKKLESGEYTLCISAEDRHTGTSSRLDTDLRIK